MCHDGVSRNSEKRNPAFKKWSLFIYDHGVGVCSWFWNVSVLSTVIVVLLSIISLILIIISGIKNRSCCSYGVFAGIALGMMMVGALGMNIVPKEYFGIVERFSVFAATGFQAVLGMHLYRMELNN